MIQKIKKSIVDNSEFLGDFIMAYGVVLVITICILCIKGTQDLLTILLDSFVPTTIAFCGAIVTQKVTKFAKIVSPVLFVLIVFIACFYIAFVAINAIEVETDILNKNYAIGIVIIVLMIVCLYFSKRYYPENGDFKDIANRQSDGSLV